MKSARIVLCGTLLAAVPLGASVFARLEPGPASQEVEDSEDDHDLAYKALQSGRIVPFAKIMDWLEREYEGYILEIELESEGGALTYEVDFLTPQKKVIELEFDAESGALRGIPNDALQAAKRAK